MYCASCEKYPLMDGAGADVRAPAFCATCSGATTARTWQELTADLGRIRYLLGELAQWGRQGLVDEWTRTRLQAPYRAQLRWASEYLRQAMTAVGDEAGAVRASAELAETEALLAIDGSAGSSGDPTAAGGIRDAQAEMRTSDEPGAEHGSARSPGEAASPWQSELVHAAYANAAGPPPPQAIYYYGAAPSPWAPSPQVSPWAPPPQVSAWVPGMPESQPPSPAALPAFSPWAPPPQVSPWAPAPHSGAVAEVAFAPAVISAAAPSTPPAPSGAGRLVSEVRPVLYENFILFLGAFLIFSGSIYFATYFWDRLGSLGPLVAGSLLSIYASGFAGLGYLLQRRYKAELSARVMFGIATAIYPVAATLTGAPMSLGGGGTTLLSAAALLVGTAAAYPAITVASALFQREISRPFTRAALVLLLAIGFAPLLMRVAPRAAGVLALYLATLPIAAMYRRLRDVGRVYEPETVVYVVAGSAYLLVAVAVRMALLFVPALTLPEVAPLAVVLAIAATDLDVAWRVRSRAVRSTLGVVGILAHATAVLAVVMALPHPLWRVLTTFAVAILFAVTALRHRRAYALHLAFGLAAAGWLMVSWLCSISPPRWVPMTGAVLLPWSLLLARLALRWRKHAAPEYAGVVERWVVIGAVLAAVLPAAPAFEASWRILREHPLTAHLAALIWLPATSVTLFVAWAWARRRAYLTCATLALSAAALVSVHVAGLPPGWLAAATAACALAAATVAHATNDDLRVSMQRAAFLLGTAAILVAAVVLPRLGEHSPELALWAGATAAAILAATSLTLAASFGATGMGRACAVVALYFASIAVVTPLVPRLPAGLLLGALPLAFLALDRFARPLRLASAQPFRDVYPFALVSLGLAGFALLSSAGGSPDGLATVAPIDPLLIAAALLWIAARHQSAWPTYAAFAFLLGAAFAAPAALELAMRPVAAVKLAGLALIFTSLVLVVASRWSPRLRALRPVFLDIPLHLAAIAAPLSFWRFAETAASWEAHQDGLLLLRRLAQPLALSLLAAYTHHSRVHAYLAAAGVALVAPLLAVVASASDFAPLATAATAIALWLAAVALDRSARAAAPLAPPMRLFELFELPTAPTARDLSSLPLAAVSAVAAAIALALALGHTAVHWEVSSSPATALTYATITAYALVRCRHLAAHPGTVRLCAHLAALAFTATCLEAAPLAKLSSLVSPRGAALLAALFLALAELFARVSSERAAAARRTAGGWAIAAALLAATLSLPPQQLTAPLAAILLAAALFRYRHHQPALPGLTPAASIAAMVAAATATSYALHLAAAPSASDASAAGALDAFDALRLHLAALGLVASLGGVAHYWARYAFRLTDARALRYAARWALLGCALAFVSIAQLSPSGALHAIADVTALAAIAVAIAALTFAASRSGQARYGHTAWLALLLFYARLRLSPLAADLTPLHDTIVLGALAFALHLAAELLRRAAQTTLERCARAAAGLIPIFAAAVAGLAWLDGDPAMSTLRVALLAESLGVLYTLILRSGGPRLLGLVAIVLYNLGLALLWMNSGRRDPLYYTLPAGASVVLVARIYKESLGQASRRGLHTAGALLVYFSTYYRVVQFDSGFYPLLLGGLTLAGLAAGFFLQLRDLFLISIGFIALNVISNLAYYGVHRPLLGWTLLTVVGLGLTACGVLFQLRRTQLSALVSRIRNKLSQWE
jgi:hypothetical protein